MAKVPFTKLYTKEELGKVKIFTWNEQEIEVKQYLSLVDKSIIANNLIAEIDENTYYLNPSIIESTFEMLVVMNYTNVSFTDKQKGEDIIKTYNILKEIGFIKEVISAIPEQEFSQLKYFCFQFLDNVITYKASANAIINNFVATTEKTDINLQNTLDNIKNNSEVINLAKSLVEAENLSLDEGTEEENDNIIKLNNIEEK